MSGRMAKYRGLLRHRTRRGALLLLVQGIWVVGACGAGPDDGRFDNPFVGGTGSKQGSGGASSASGGGAMTGTIDYPPTFLDLGRPPGPPERGYAEVPARDGDQSGDGASCSRCAHSGDCAAGACVVNLDTGEQFCASSCDSDADCENPEKQECLDVTDGSDMQCVPRVGTCYELDTNAVPLNPIRPFVGAGGSSGGTSMGGAAGAP